MSADDVLKMSVPELEAEWMRSAVCQAKGCEKRPLTGYGTDTSHGPMTLWLCEHHGDLLAVGFELDPLP